MKVLVVDDSGIERLVMRSAIEHYGHACVEASSLSEAWDALEREAFDAVLTDWLMPGGSGPELCQRIRERTNRPYVYVALCTGLSDREHGLEGVRAGADTFLTKPIDPIGLKMCLIAAQRMTEVHNQLARQNAELTLLNSKLEERARTDPLTGLGNRHQLHEDLQQLAALARRFGSPLAAAMCDVDRFKAYNDRFGHMAGDEALRSVGRTIAAACRSSDNLYRFGGEEMVVLFPRVSAEACLQAVARIREMVQGTCIWHPDNEPYGVVTISVGVADVSGPDTGRPEELLRRADEALYEAKRTGRNRVVLHNQPVIAG